MSSTSHLSLTARIKAPSYSLYYSNIAYLAVSCIRNYNIDHRFVFCPSAS